MKKVIMINTKTRTIRVENADKNIDWITVKGTHVPIEKGQSKSAAVKSFVEKKRPAQKENPDAKYAEYATRKNREEAYKRLSKSERHAVDTMSKWKRGEITDEEFVKRAQQPAKPRWDGGKKTPYKDAPTLYEFLKKNDYTYPDMDKYKSYTWEQFLDDAHKGTVPKPFAKADTAQVDKLYDYAFHKTGKNQDEFADWVKKSVTWHGDSKPTPSKKADVSDIVKSYKEKMAAVGPRASIRKTDRIEADAIKEFMTRKLGADRPYEDYYQYWLNGMDKATEDAFNEIYNESEAREMAFSELASDVDHSGMARGEPTYDELMQWSEKQKAKKAEQKRQAEEADKFAKIKQKEADDAERKRLIEWASHVLTYEEAQQIAEARKKKNN